jgi:hypothetical protein
MYLFVNRQVEGLNHGQQALYRCIIPRPVEGQGKILEFWNQVNADEDPLLFRFLILIYIHRVRLLGQRINPLPTQFNRRTGDTHSLPPVPQTQLRPTITLSEWQKTLLALEWAVIAIG